MIRNTTSRPIPPTITIETTIKFLRRRNTKGLRAASSPPTSITATRIAIMIARNTAVGSCPGMSGNSPPFF